MGLFLMGTAIFGFGQWEGMVSSLHFTSEEWGEDITPFPGLSPLSFLSLSKVPRNAPTSSMLSLVRKHSASQAGSGMWTVAAGSHVP